MGFGLTSFRMKLEGGQQQICWLDYQVVVTTDCWLNYHVGMKGS